MGTPPPEYCSQCGAELITAMPRSAYYCEPCERTVFHTPAPNARIAVVDGDRLLLHEIAAEEVTDRWTTPGGHVEAGEEPAAAAVRELEEETGLTAAPADLVLFDARTVEKFEGSFKLWLMYAVDRSDTAGSLRAGADASDVRFWTPTELETAEQTFTPRQPADYRELDRWIERARAALASEGDAPP